jgi:hypothetical protein
MNQFLRFHSFRQNSQGFQVALTAVVKGNGVDLPIPDIKMNRSGTGSFCFIFVHRYNIPRAGGTGKPPNAVIPNFSGACRIYHFFKKRRRLFEII